MANIRGRRNSIWSEELQYNVKNIFYWKKERSGLYSKNKLTNETSLFQ